MRRVLVLVAAAGLLTGCTGYLWGDNTYGQLGNGTSTGGATVPTAVPSGGDWYVLAAGERHTCGVQIDRSLWCWGRNRYGNIGNGAGGLGTPDEPSPVQVGTGIDWRLVEGSVAGGFTQTCAIDRSRRLWCWGDNGSGQLGDGTVTDRFTPVQVGSASDWSLVTAGARHTCGIRNTDELYCWGDNGLGQLGVGDTTDRVNPAQVTGSWSDVDAGRGHTCAITTTGDLYCWGSNSAGQIGRNTVNPSFDSPAVPDQANQDPLRTWTSVSAGASHTCGIYDDASAAGVARCAGSSSAGQLGQGGGPGGGSSFFGLLASGSRTDWSQIAAGGEHTCALKNGDLWCWGANTEGQLGNNGSTSDTGNPTLVSLIGDWTDVSAGDDFTVGLRNEN